MIKSVKFVNFKSLSPQTVELGPLNVLIGANASGKSNFVDAFKFLQECLREGLSRAVAHRLGWRNTLARRCSAREAMRLEFHFDSRGLFEVALNKEAPPRPAELSYAVEVRCMKDRPYVRAETYATAWAGQRLKETEAFERQGGMARFQSLGQNRPVAIQLASHMRDRLILEAPFPSVGPSALSHAVAGWRFYEFDAGVARKPSTWETTDRLLADGSNLARALESLRNAGNALYQRLGALMGILVPGFQSWQTERRSDGTVGFAVSEKGIAKPFPPAAISDGTIRILCILLAVLSQPMDAYLISIDEPERCLHPQLLKTLVEVMRQASQKTQMLVTTHSAELVRWLQPSEVLLVDKKENQTVIVRAQDVEHIEEFLKEFRLDELWLSGYLKGGTAL